MADDDGKVEVTKDVLAPAEGPREEIITTAVKFLQNPKVRQSPLSQRKAFLLKKGLTKEEIDIAVQKAGVGQDDKVMQVFPPQSSGQMAPRSNSGTQQMVSSPVDIYTKWQKVRDILSVIALASGLTYAAYKFYKEILKPWLLGQPRMEERLFTLEKLQSSVVERLTAVQETLTGFQEQVSKEQEKVQQLSHEIHAKQSSEILQTSQDSQTMNDVKSELSSIKGLLLNRRQFPPTPASTPLLPSWQLSSSPGERSVPITNGKPSLVTPSGDSGNMTDALGMLNSNDNTREDNSDGQTNNYYM
ncbi:peroxisomal membrane protein PEX14-like isoform X2 [Mizuhopecten yessoensis]|uniref:peroxisomal membrane protein PEX14-like isoform X2 n=1 Tax=Mizuhopecten yessoensis TaxID=6573 RepID=UPI000B457EA7|nr:peroxisomal membrane protein PEX14-like isoform X2 [Mizuhopecten yessoensis]